MEQTKQQQSELTDWDRYRMYLRQYYCYSVEEIIGGGTRVVMLYNEDPKKEDLKEKAPFGIILLFAPGEKPSEMKPGVAWTM